MDRKCELILALDVPDGKEAHRLMAKLEGSLSWVKIGLQLYTAAGPDLVREAADRGLRVFLDLKLHDIPNTVAKAVESLSRLPIRMLTLHTSGGLEMMREALRAQQATSPDLLLLGVTVLTSMDDTELARVGIPHGCSRQVATLARLAAEAGMGGLVCSPLEVPELRRDLGAQMRLVVPGVRPADSAADEQKRTATPAETARSGANFIVVGRPILRADDPAEAARAIRRALQDDPTAGTSFGR